jgi:hypothetical protein
VRQLNFTLESTKQQLSVQSKLAALNVRFNNEAEAPATDPEISRLQSLLDERTNNVAVLMQTVETLQTAVSSAASAPSADDDTATQSVDDSMMSGTTSHTASAAQNFAHAALAKRVISLTAELSSASAVASMMERRAEQMSLEVQQRNKLASFLSAKLKLYEEENGKHAVRAGIIADEHNRLTSTFNRELSATMNENNELRRGLAATETKLRDGEIEQAALSSDIVVLEETVGSLRSKLRQVTADSSSSESSSSSSSSPPPSHAASHPSPPLNLTDQLRITSIIENFTDQLSQMRSSSKTHRRTKQQDEQIFNWVTDVIVKTDAQLLELARDRNELQKELRKTVIERDSMDLALEEATQREAHLVKRVDLCQAALTDREKLKFVQTENALAFMEGRVRQVQDELVSMSEKDLYVRASEASARAKRA